MPCQCSGPGYCQVYNRMMSQVDYDICSGAVPWMKERYREQWLRESKAMEGTTTGCIYNMGPALDEHGIQRVRRGCGCGGRRKNEPLITCTHPLHTDPMPDDCESRCGHFKGV